VIRDRAVWEAWEDEYLRSTPVDFHRNLQIADAMHEQARALGLFPLADPYEGLDTCIKLARALNVQFPIEGNCSKS